MILLLLVNISQVSKTKVESPDRKESRNEKKSYSKTPEALEHMPDSKKAEYKRLKAKLAQYEKKKRQPLSAVNQDKGKICSNFYWPFRNSAGNWGEFHILTTQ